MTPPKYILDLESWGQQKIRTFEDTEEGGKAFREQRAPEFKGQ